LRPLNPQAQKFNTRCHQKNYEKSQSKQNRQLGQIPHILRLTRQ